MSRASDRRSSKKSKPRRQPRPAWNEHAPNKRQKKRIVQGEATSGSGRCERQPQPAKEDHEVERPSSAVRSLIDSFSEVVDPRVNRQRRHLLIDIIVIAVLGVMARGDGWKEIHMWGEANQQWLQTFLELPNGIPSRDTFRRTISRLDPDQFQQAFLGWLAGVTQNVEGVVAIDGKTMRRSGNGDKKPLHIVSAWATEQHLTLGQLAVDEKSNEITAIPQLLATLALKGAIVTIDAMGCQKEIAAQIIAAHADYCLAVKDNQPTLSEDIKNAFMDAMEDEFASTSHGECETHNEAHGRTETRYYYTMPVPDTLRTAHEWEGLNSIGMTVTHRDVDCDGEIRYYINSFASDAKQFASAVRSHWGIENSLHWVLDVTFREDDSRIHKDHGAENVSWLRRLAVSLIKLDTTIKDSIRAKRIRAGYNVNFLKQMLASISEKI